MNVRNHTPAMSAGFAMITLLAAAPVVHAGAASIAPWGVDLSGRDLDVRPQDDFFRHSNGGWLEGFDIPADLGSYGSFTQLFLDAEEQVRAILEEAAASGAATGTDARKVGDLYADYLDEAAIEKAGLAPIEEELARARALRTHADVAFLLASFARRGGTSPFVFYVDQDEKQPSRYIAHFVQSGLGLPNRDYYLEEDNELFARAREVYAKYVEKLLTFAGESDPGMRAARIIALEKRLAEAHWPSEDTRDIDKTYNLMSDEQLASSAPGLPWKIYLDEFGLGEQHEFIVTTPSAYTGMAKVFAETDVEVWRDWFVYRTLRNRADLLPKAVDDAHFEFQSQALTGAQQQRDRWKRAVQFVNGTMGEAVGRIYVERHFPPESKRRMDELVDNLIVAMGERIDGLTWMSAETKTRAREKLAKFNVKIGYPDEWRNYTRLEVRRGDLVGNARRAIAFEYERQLKKLSRPLDRNEWLMNAQEVNAYYNAGLNEIVFPAAILQPPFFDPAADDAVNYGGIGAVIGHEIGHGFDDQGRKADGDGVLRDWWTEDDGARFREKADMLVRQYDGFIPLDGMSVNGELTLGENIGDVGGLEIAYHAYRLSLGGKEPAKVDGLTGDQRFFLGFSQIWRGKIRDELMAQLLASDPHSPVEFRVNGALRNVDAWYAAFDVKPGDAMYLPPEERVRIG
ncbi:MAG: M13 family metallopeptidase [Candidatus Eiseniibacteriota bacterium]